MDYSSELEIFVVFSAFFLEWFARMILNYQTTWNIYA